MRSLCVFCGSQTGNRPEYLAAATETGRSLARRGLGVVFGGGRVGLMGALADAALNEGGTVVGVIPEALMEREVAHKGLTDLRVVATMHERKALMARLSDGFLALPGGLGTLEELFEVWTWSQLGLHTKPVGLLNIAGYFTPLMVFLDHAVAERFVWPSQRAMLYVENNVGALIDRMEAHRPEAVRRWIGENET